MSNGDGSLCLLRVGGGLLTILAVGYRIYETLLVSCVLYGVEGVFGLQLCIAIEGR